MSFGEVLKRLRQEAELTQQQLAEKINLSKANVSKYEANLVEPNLDTLRLIAEVFNVSSDYLLEKTNIPSFDCLSLNAHEEKVILAYRSKPSMRPAVDRLLDVDSEPSESTGASYIAAAGENPGGGTTHFSKEELAALHSTPDTDEDF